MRHKWSGWPGAICLNCGISDPIEEALADNLFDPLTDIWKDEKQEEITMWKMSCCPPLPLPERLK
jgi:hypothetical protein